jgi:hypothetical protein
MSCYLKYNCFNCPFTACSCCSCYWFHYCECCGANLNTGGHYSWCCKCSPKVIYVPQPPPQPRWRLEWVPEQPSTAKKRSDRDW